MKVIFLPKAEKQFKSLGKAVRIIITRKIREPFFISNKEEKLKGHKNIFRIRVGDYRLVYRKTSVEIYIILVGHRREIYRLLNQLLK